MLKLAPEIKYSLIIVIGVLSGIIWTVLERPQVINASPSGDAVAGSQYQEMLLSSPQNFDKSQFVADLENPLFTVDPSSDVFGSVQLLQVESSQLKDALKTVSLGWKIAFLGENNGWYRYQVIESKQTDIDTARQLVPFYDDVVLLYVKSSWYSDNVTVYVLKEQQ